jgi:hypothetical protein
MKKLLFTTILSLALVATAAAVKLDITPKASTPVWVLKGYSNGSPIWEIVYR